MLPDRMRPFASLPDTALARVAGVACDLDDTLTAHALLTSSSLDSLHRLAAAGIPCMIVTGRPLGWADVLARLLPVRAVVTENGGAWIARESHGPRVAFLEDEATRRTGMARVERMVDELTERHPELSRVRDLTARVTDVALDLHESANVSDAVANEAMRAVRNAGLHAIASTIHLHVSARAPDKVAGMRAAMADVGLDPEQLGPRWLYVGDSPNDASAFAAVEMSIGVANVRAFEGRMPCWPAFVTDGGAGAGFAEVVSRLIAAREGWSNGGTR